MSLRVVKEGDESRDEVEGKNDGENDKSQLGMRKHDSKERKNCIKFKIRLAVNRKRMREREEQIQYFQK